MLKSFAMGVATTVGILAVSTILGHSTLGIVTLPFMFPMMMIALPVCYALTHGHAGALVETVQMYTMMILAGGLFYGLLFRLFWPRKDKISD